MGMEEYAFALKMRDIIKGIVADQIRKLRPEVRIAKVYDFNATEEWVEILFPGDKKELRAKCSISNMPQKRMLDFPDGSGDYDLVRVAKTKSGYYITEVMTSIGCILGFGSDGGLIRGIWYGPTAPENPDYLWIDTTT